MEASPESNAVNPDSKIRGRVFCLGMNKTGTSTLKRCFKELGYRPIASPGTYSRAEIARVNHFYKYKNYEDMLQLAERFQAFEDRPWNMWRMYRELHERFPDSRFILTFREPESWWRSVEQWITVTKPESLARYQLHLRVLRPDRNAFIDSYLRYNEEVRSYFGDSGILLPLNVEAGADWAQLCDFLGKPIPEAPFPHANPQTYSWQDADRTKRKFRPKHAIICQHCKHPTIFNTSVPGSRSAAKTGSKGIRRLSPGNIRQEWRKPTVQDLQHSPVVRRAMYATHRLLNTFRSPAAAGTRRQGDRPLPEDELGIVSCFFNPTGSRRRLQNFKQFLAAVDATGLRCVVVELAFGSNPFEITDRDDLIQVRCDDVLWHKERLINLGIGRLLSQGMRKIAWLDGDILFQEKNWPIEIARRLDHARLCQVFEKVKITADDHAPPMLGPSSVKYFRDHGRLLPQPPLRSTLARGMLLGGQSGFGWAARAEVLEQSPLFEHAVVGGGDKLILAASFADQLSDQHMERLTQSNFACESCGYRNRSSAYTKHYLRWAERWNAAVNGSVDYARLTISDLYHGKRQDRAYMTRHDILYRHEFDPAGDLVESSAGCLQWADGKGLLSREVEAYFLARRDDA
ncbi:sulfotransferase family protein [Wenzhouxiangellaceae bacterium CH-27]|uniref:Sulfotransferase family protein n=1 Tax=Elongatibacter sediminis TaxID=3119006 RepID=A0AAW9RHK3_9GAMM